MTDHDFVNWITDDEGRVCSLYIVEESDLTINGMMIRSDYLEEVGVDVPTTYAELHDTLAAFQTELGTGTMWLNYMGNAVNNFLGNGYGINTYYYPEEAWYPIYVEDGQVHFTYIEEGAREYLSMIREWYEEGLIFSDFTTASGEIKVEYTEDLDRVYTGEFGVISTGLTYIDSHVSSMEG